MKKIVIATGGFDPIHSGHIQYLKRAKELGDILYVGVNSDEWLVRKKRRFFMRSSERLKIIQELKFVDYTISFNDDDGSAKNAIKLIREMHPDDHIIFANGGDRTKENIPEMDVNADLRYTPVEFVFGIGGTNKINSSSWILDEWKSPKKNRAWGYYRVLHENGPEVKLKELTVEPGICLSMQKHDDRSEFWFIAEGKATVYSLDQHEEPTHLGFYEKFDHIFIQKGQWHRLCNESEKDLKVIEIQYGANCIEEDIVRL